MQDLDAMLDDLARSAADAARLGALGDAATTATVHRVIARVRRRRATRTAGRGLAAACAIGAIGLVATQLRELVPADPVGPGTTTPSPSGTPSSTPSGTPPATPTEPPVSPTDPPAGLTGTFPGYGIFRCGEPVNLSIHALPESADLTLAADLSADKATWSVTVGATGGHRVVTDLPAAGTFALVDDAGVVVGWALPGGQGHARHEIGPDTTVRLDDTTFWVGCGPDGEATAAWAEDGFNGTFTVWPYVEAHPVSSTDAEGASSTPPPTVLVVANPQVVDLTGL